jgi:hypothetical protein
VHGQSGEVEIQVFAAHPQAMERRSWFSIFLPNRVYLKADQRSKGNIHGQRTAGIGEDRSIDFRANFERIPIRAWLPEKWKARWTGRASGSVHWTGPDPKLENSSGEGALRLQNAHADNVQLLEEFVEVQKSFEHLELNDCSLNFAWRYPKIEINDIALEEKGKFRVEGAICVERRAFRGQSSSGLLLRI